MAVPAFADPESSSIFYCSELRDERRLKKFLNHPFNQSVQIVVPNVYNIPERWISLLSSQDILHFIVRDLPLHCLIDKTFIEAFIKNGKFYALSLNRNIELDDCVAVSPSGSLIISCTKETYHRLGIQGKPSCFKKTGHTKYVVRIDVTKPSFTPGKNNYEAVYAALKRREDLVFDFIITWNPPEPDICSTSIQAYFASNGYVVEKQSTACHILRNFTVVAPKIDADKWEGSDEGHACDVFFEWLGAQVCGISCTSDNPDNYDLSTFYCPDPCETYGQVVTLQCRGFFTIEKIWSLVCEVRNFFSGDSVIPFIGILVHGFEDSPISWGDQEHRCTLTGENMYSVVIFPSGKCWLYAVADACDHGITKL